MRACQVRTGAAAGGIQRSIEKLKKASDSFNKRQSEIRIDYVQHGLSAMIGYAELKGWPAKKIQTRESDVPLL